MSQKYTLSIDGPMGSMHYKQDDDLPGFSIPHSQRFDATQFNSIEKVRELAFEMMSPEMYKFHVWDLNQDCRIMTISV